MKDMIGENCELTLTRNIENKKLFLQLWRIYGKNKITVNDGNRVFSVEADSVEEIKKFLEEINVLIKESGI